VGIKGNTVLLLDLVLKPVIFVTSYRKIAMCFSLKYQKGKKQCCSVPSQLNLDERKAKGWTAGVGSSIPRPAGKKHGPCVGYPTAP
jgi:hypothetical protein